MRVWFLAFDSTPEFWNALGVYSTPEKAEAEKARLMAAGVYRDEPDGFEVYEFELDAPSSLG